MLTPERPQLPKRRMDGLVPRTRATQARDVPEVAQIVMPPTIPEVAKPEPTAVKPRHKRIRTWAMVAVLVMIVPVIVLAMFTPARSSHKFAPVSLVVSAAKAAIEKPAQLQGQTTGRTNFLIYGMTKDGLRTDSIMLASYYWAQKKLVTLNIPRDLYVYDGYENAKMGEVYAYAKGRQPHNSTYPDTFVASVIAKEYNIPIQYWAKFNMQGEVQLVDTLGGVDINVPDTFTDYEYPTWDYSGYIRPAPHFNAGLQHMNGNTALIFSRSRHSLQSGEGTDFARSKRQALVLSAVMDRVKTMGILGNLADVLKYLNILGSNVDTNLSSDEMVAAAQLLRITNPQTDYLRANWATGNGFLCDSTSSIGAYITLYGVPGSCGTKAGGRTDSSYREMAVSYVQNLLSSASPAPSPTPLSASPSPSPSPIP